jgi:hypothetical protein
VSVFKAIFGFLWDFLYFLTGEGSWKLRHHERIVLEAAISSLDEAIQIPLRTQLKQKINMTPMLERVEKDVAD